MSIVTILVISVGLAMDAFAVAIAGSIALGQVSGRQLFRFSFHFGLFQAFMPVIGWAAGRSFFAAIEAWDHWVAFGLLALIGGKAIYEALSPERSKTDPNDPTRGWSLVVLSTATSIDALAVGLSFAVLDVVIWYPCAVIGVVTAGLTFVGMQLGSRIGLRFGRRMRIVGGLVLIGIGIKILVEHL